MSAFNANGGLFMSFKLFVLAVGLALCNLNAAAQSSTAPSVAQQPTPRRPPQDLFTQVPTPKPEDIKSIDSILAALYNVISGPAGERDWNRFRSLFVPAATLTSARKDSAGNISIRSRSVEDYVKGGGGYFAQHGFFESPIVNRVQTFGDIAQVFSSYESRNAAGEAPFARGINSFQLAFDGKRWWIVSVLWDEERPDNPLPKEFAAKTGGSGS
jgi:hypothetical protein